MILGECRDGGGRDSESYGRESVLRDKINPREAVFGFMAWLTTRSTPVVLGSQHDSSIAAELVAEWCNANDLPAVRKDMYPNNITHPVYKQIKEESMIDERMTVDGMNKYGPKPGWPSENDLNRGFVSQTQAETINKLFAPGRSELNDCIFRQSLQQLINKHSMENGSNTPDFMLATYLLACLQAFDEAVKCRSEWYGRPEHIATTLPPLQPVQTQPCYPSATHYECAPGADIPKAVFETVEVIPETIEVIPETQEVI